MVPPTHRVIIDRRTGKWVGPPIPIDPRDWPYRDVPFTEILWRYMDFRKFEDLLKSSTLYFSRGDRFKKDPFEGRFSQGNSDNMSKSDQAFHKAYKIAPIPNESIETMRRCVFISCWHRNRKESGEMWRAYTSTPESVVVVTSGKALYSFIPKEVQKSAVRYHHDAFARTEFDYHSLFFYKPSRYAFENEFRLLLPLGDDDTVTFDNPDDLYRRVPIRPKKIVRRVIAHPNASREFKVKVEKLMKMHLPHLRYKDSSVLC